jgi:uncharacterized protein (TIGR02118 family)
MIKLVALVNKKEEMSKEDFEGYWLNIHAPLEKKWPGLKKYVISISTESFGGREPDYDGMAELWFDNRVDLEKALESEERMVSKEDFLRFVGNAKIILTEEHVILDEMRASEDL